MKEAASSRAAEYFGLLEHIRSKYKLGEETALVILQEVAADLRAQGSQVKTPACQDGCGSVEGTEGSGVAEQNAPGAEPATEKQLAYLKNLGVQPGRELSKQEASALIDQALGKPKEDKKETDEAEDEEMDVKVVKV